jgi:hypothetical protein
MIVLRDIHYNRQEHEQGMMWATKSAELGVPRAMFDLGAGTYTRSLQRST